MAVKTCSSTGRRWLAVLAVTWALMAVPSVGLGGKCAMCAPGCCPSERMGGCQVGNCQVAGCQPTGSHGPLGGGANGDVLLGEDWLNRPYAPGLYWIGPDSHLRPPCPQLYQYLPGIYQPVYAGHLPRWYVSAEYLALFRDTDQTVPFATLGADPERVVLSTSDFNADFQSGVRGLVGVQWNDHIRLEGSYFGSYTWQDLASINNVADNDLGGIGNLFSPFSGFGNPADPNVDYNTRAIIEYESRMNNAEFNLRHRLLLPPNAFEASVLLGARYMSIDESFGYLSENEAGLANALDVETSNDLIGIQMGLLGQFLLTPWSWLDWEIKGAVANNSARQRTQFSSDSLGANTDRNRDEDTTAYIGETSLVLNYQFRPSLTFRVGYQAIWVTGVALADQNFETNLATLIDGPAQLDHSADVVYHGFNIGLVYVR